MKNKATKNKKVISNKNIKNKALQINNLHDDLAKMIIPFNLLTPLIMVTEEFKSKGFVYSHSVNEKSTLSASFNSEKLKEKIIVHIEKENLFIKQFSMNDGKRKLKVIYVVKPSERTFKLV